MNRFKPLFYLLGSLFLFGCGSSSSNSTGLALHSLDFQCDSSTFSQCSATYQNRSLLVGLISYAQRDCLTLFTQYNYDFKLFPAHGETLTYYSLSHLNGRVETFTDSAGKPVTELKSGVYLVCAFVDFNGNRRLDSGEVYLEENYDIRTNFLRNFTNWALKN
jgi:hypothetical protein